MVKWNELNEAQKCWIISGAKCVEGFWENTQAFQLKKTIYTIDEVGDIWVTTNKNKGARLVTMADINRAKTI